MQRDFPESTYRLQFHKGFTFRDAAAIIPYLAELGITHVYASPYLKATSGSTHGYDVIDPCTLNPELGTSDDYETWLATLKDHGLSHILDIVPNHVGVATNENKWWNDVLKHGPASQFANYFDIAWQGSPRPELHNKILLPLLGKPYADALEGGELRLVYENGEFAIDYYERRFPIDPRTYSPILARAANRLGRELGAHSKDFQEHQKIRWAFLGLPEVGNKSNEFLRHRDRELGEVQNRLAKLVERNSKVRHAIEQTLLTFNGEVGVPGSFDKLDDLLNHQHYRLAWWRTASDEINYRRFFDINDLAALAMEREEVFQATHRFILELVAQGKVTGLRIDHPDGLYDPKQYFERLQSATGNSQSAIPIYAEKILATHEPLRPDWPIHGTTGYDFLNMTNGLFIDPANEQAFTQLYEDWSGDRTPFPEIAYQKKRLILETALASELQMLTHRLDRLAQRDRRSRDFTLNTLRHALREVIACFHVYRTYITDGGIADTDATKIETAVEQAILRNPKTEPAAFHFILDTLLLNFGGHHLRAEQVRFAGKFQQLTAPATAKGVEDTAFYCYHRLISLNEVGGDPADFGVSPDDLHAYLQDRQEHWPRALSALSTHDTKRSEDVRARINVLSEIPEQWRERVRKWRDLNIPHRTSIAPDEEYLLYQTLIGAWPPDSSQAASPEFVERIQAYMQKAMREAKLRTSWTSPNETHERAVQDLIDRILNPDSEFLKDFQPFQKTVAHFGLLNSLGQTLLRLTAPGVPDTYQGTELWDLSLVDPDNRRPVDYARRRQLLRSLKSGISKSESQISDLTSILARAHTGELKLFITTRSLHARRAAPGQFSTGQYIPVHATGPRADHVFAFARTHNDRTAITIVPRLLTRIIKAPHFPTGQSHWKDTYVVLPNIARVRLRNLFSDEIIFPETINNSPAIPIGQALATFPVALLLSAP